MRRAGVCMAATWVMVAALWLVGVGFCAAKYWWLSVIFAWCALSNIAIAICYLWKPEFGVLMLAKDVQTGGLSWQGWWLAPYLVGLWFFWAVKHLILGEHPFDLVAEGIYVGRFCMRYPSEFPVECTHIVDLTAEFPVRKRVLMGRTFRCLPSMDREMPEEQPLGLLAREVADWGGITYIHCANGHGRSAVLAAMVLVLRGHCTTVAEGVELMKLRRSVISCQPHQMSTGQNALQYARGKSNKGIEMTPRSLSVLKTTSRELDV